MKPVLVNQDKEYAVFVHQDRVGKQARRILTCVDANGIKKWTVPPDVLFSAIMEAEPGDMGGQRQGNLFVLNIKRLGAIGFDLASGRRLWQI